MSRSTAMTDLTDPVDTTWDVVVCFEYDDPEDTAALTWVQSQVITPTMRALGRDVARGITVEHRATEVEDSWPSEDQRVPGNQEHEIRARFEITGDGEVTRSTALGVFFARLREVYFDDLIGLCIDGDWANDGEYLSGTVGR